MAGLPSSVISTLAKRLHPGPLGLPLTPREATHLSNAFQKSFRNILSKEHGGERATAAPTNALMAFILDSPHFAGSQGRDSDQAGAPVRSLSFRQTAKMTAKTVRTLQDQLLRPMELFAQQVAAGEATLALAKECMRMCYMLEPSASQDTGAGAAICNWLRSTGLEESLEFIYDRDFLPLLIRCLYTEKKQARLDTWHNMLNQRLRHSSSSSDTKSLTRAGNTLWFWHIYYEMRFVSLEAAIQLFNRTAFEYRPMNDSPVDLRLTLSSAGNYLISSLAPTPLGSGGIEGYRTEGSVSSDVYDDFMYAVRSWGAKSQRRMKTARLTLFHPTRPSEQPAVHVLFTQNNLTTVSGAASYVNLFMATVQWLTDRGREQEAAQILDELNDFCPREEVQELNPNGGWTELFSKIRNVSKPDDALTTAAAIPH